MGKQKLQIEKVYSNVYDPKIHSNISESPVWKQCYHETDLQKSTQQYVYTIAFNGLKPVQVTNLQKLTL